MSGIKGQGKGRKLSLEHSQKISKSLKGRVLSDNWKQKIRMGNIGKKMTSEAIEKIRVSKKYLTVQNRENISNAQKGKIPSIETRIKISNANKGKKRTQETREKMRLAQLGEKSHLWRGGISDVNNKVRTSLEYKLWRESVYKRDDYTCVWCGLKSGNGKAVILNADHIKPFAYYPELRFAIDNGRTLCLDCHKTTENYAGKGYKRNKNG